MVSRNIAKRGLGRLRAQARSWAYRGKGDIDLNRQLAELRSAVDAQGSRLEQIASALVDLDNATARRTTTVVDAVSTRHADMWELANRNHSAVETMAEQRSKDLWALVCEQYADTRAVLEASPRNAHIDELRRLILQLNADEWDAARRLHDSVMRRIADVERQIRGGNRTSSAQLPTLDQVREAIRVYLRDGVVDRVTVAGLDSSTPSLRCSSKLGDFDLVASDTVIAPYLREHHEWEPEVEHALREIVGPGDVVVEIGAHVGYFAVLLASLTGPSGRVVAIEADPHNAVLLDANTTRIASSPVLPLWLAATDRSGTTRLARSPESNSGDARILDWPISGDVEDVAGVALDEVWPSDAHVDVVLVDVQGFDHIALSGFGSVIVRCRPKLLVEYWPEAIIDGGGDPAAVLALFQTWGYQWSATEDASIGPDTGIDDLVHRATHSTTGFLNLLLMPTR